MKRTTKITLIYTVVATLSLALILFFRHVATGVPEADLPPVSDAGRLETEIFFPIEKDLALTLQDGSEAMLSEIRGEVTVLAQFFAVCPHCAVRNGVELGEIERVFGDHPDFRIVCVTVDPETDGVEELAAYAEALGADVEDWWFASAGDEATTHRYLEEVLKFFAIRERRDEVDIASHGRFAHDLGFLVIDRDFNVIGKWPLADARSDEARERDPHLYERLKEDMYERIRTELSKEEDAGQASLAGAAGE